MPLHSKAAAACKCAAPIATCSVGTGVGRRRTRCRKGGPPPLLHGGGFENEKGRAAVLSKRALVLVGSIVSLFPEKGQAQARAAEEEDTSGRRVSARVVSGLASCSCPAKTPCPATANWAVENLPPSLIAWSNVTGTCLPWGPGGPVGILIGSALFRKATLDLLHDTRTFKDARDAKTRRSLEVEQGLRSLDKQAKQNAPFIGATFVLVLSCPRTLEAGPLIFLVSAALGVLAARFGPKQQER